MLNGPLGRRWLIGVGLTWVIAVAAGLLLLMRYQMTPGAASAAEISLRWPGTDAIPLSRQGHTLVLSMHPHCACSHATVEELNRLMARCREKLEVTVLMYQPSDQPEAWSHTRLWDEAAAIPGVNIRADRDGVLSARFGARTSGQVFLYDRTGRLLFDGGITGSRGHAGDNAGVDAVIALVQGGAGRGSHARTPTFGCGLGTPSSSAAQKTVSEEGVAP